MIGTLLFTVAAILCLCFSGVIPAAALLTSEPIVPKDELLIILDRLLDTRNNAMVHGDAEAVKTLYDRNTRNGLWAYEHQIKKMKYLQNWSDKQGVQFTAISSKIQLKWTKNKGQDALTANFLASTEYRYAYENLQDLENVMRIGTYHIIDLKKVEDSWIITKEWYTDPFADSLNLENLKTEENKAFILSQEARDFTSLTARRKSAVEYADRYCGAAGTEETGFSYNKKYKDYNPLGGDCANFASQILHEGGKFKKTGYWNYEKDGSRAWVNAQGFKDFMLGSGRASLIAYGSYSKVLKASYKLVPGDFVAYEKKGKITHISVVTGADTRGYALVNCHNTDRYRVPWDLGWSDSEIRFYLVRVHF